MTTAIIVAAGKSERMGAGTDKAFLSLGSKPVLAYSLLAFERSPEVEAIVLVVRKDQQTAAKAMAKLYGISKLAKVVAGGSRRQDSVKAGLAAVDAATTLVVVHDGARPCTTPDMVSEVVKMARKFNAVAIGRRMIDTVKLCEKATTVKETVDRSKLWTVQTPQAFDYFLLRRAYDNLDAKKLLATDDAQAVELLGESVKIYESNKPNIKITTVEDLLLAAAVVIK
ncbi:MAG: 2-C-methyl-D-erythritol 4-phosphate cytidylyltransferase [Kiritimatiellae bacterium]|nr:2-C-methyl-D-erythritol 4-phosphate cytidylyltransferase [Kiritimatiellia bacterium]